MKTRAALFLGPGQPFVVETLDLAEPRAGEVLVKVKATGVCHSDWHLMTGATKHPLPCVPGHEGAGIVEALGPEVDGLMVGDHVVLNWAPNCGSCFYCSVGRPSLCGTYVEPIWAGTMLDGTTRLSLNRSPVYHYSALACFAEYAVVSAQCCVRLASDVPFEVAALIGCAVTTGVGAVVNTAQIPAGSSVAVYGVGGVGLCAVMGAVVAGASQIVAVDSVASKLETALSFGATDAVLAGPDAVSAIRSLTEGRGADYVIECVGVPSIQEECLSAARPGGVVVLAGIAPMGSGTNFPGAVLTRQEKTVMGCYYGTADPTRDFPLYASWYREGRLPLDRLVTGRYSLGQINEAYADLVAGRNARGVVLFD
jgi:S-(hydroxymethyl)glutathione dehydrogenase / alcohol dehydrogenase